MEVFRMDYKTRIEASIQEHLDAYMDIVKTLYDNPETGFEEYEAQKVLVKYLKDAGFDVKSSVVVDTDFVAEYKSGKEVNHWNLKNLRKFPHVLCSEA